MTIVLEIVTTLDRAKAMAKYLNRQYIGTGVDEENLLAKEFLKNLEEAISKKES